MCTYRVHTQAWLLGNLYRWKMCFSSLQKWWKSFSQIYICLKISEKWLLVICNMSQNHRNQVRRSIISGFYVFLVLPLFFGSCIGSSSCLVDPLENPEGKEEVSLIDKLGQDIVLAPDKNIKITYKLWIIYILFQQHDLSTIEPCCAQQNHDTSKIDTRRTVTLGYLPAIKTTKS